MATLLRTLCRHVRVIARGQRDVETAVEDRKMTWFAAGCDVPDGIWNIQFPDV
jgi:hypothetical protein